MTTGTFRCLRSIFGYKVLENPAHGWFLSSDCVVTVVSSYNLLDLRSSPTVLPISFPCPVKNLSGPKNCFESIKIYLSKYTFWWTAGGFRPPSETHPFLRYTTVFVDITFDYKKQLYSN